MDNHIDWKLPTGLIIAGVTAWIAYKKYRLDVRKFARENHDKILPIYKNTKELISKTLFNRPSDYLEIKPLVDEIKYNYLVLDKKVQKYLNQIIEKVEEVYKLSFYIEQSHKLRKSVRDDPVSVKKTEKLVSIQNWLFEQDNKKIIDKYFSKYLKI